MHYINFRSQYKKYSEKIVPDIKSKLFEQEGAKQKVTPAQMRRIAAVSICFVIVLSAVFAVYYSGPSNGVQNNSGLPSQVTGLLQGSESENTDVSGNDFSNTDTSQQISDDNVDIPYPDGYTPRKGATKEEAEQTTLTTDKQVYIFDEIITFTIKPLYEDDVILFDQGYYIEYYDNNTHEWSRCPKEYVVQALAGVQKGSFERKFLLSERVDNIAPKYRLVYTISVNQFEVKLISNEFTIEWGTNQTTLTTDKTNYNSSDEYITYTIKAQNESDILNLAYTRVQYYDSNLRGWKDCEDKAPEKVKYGSAKGSMTDSYKIYRIGTKAEKYRLISFVNVNDSNVNLISNEFTINWENTEDES